MSLAGHVPLIVNPVSGRGSEKRCIERLEERLAQSGIPSDRYETMGPGDAGGFAATLVAERPRAIMVAGGDGTIREVVAGLSGDSTPLLVIPCGTENVLAKYLGLSASADLLWEVLEQGNTRGVDVLDCNGGPSMLVVGAGFDAEVVRRLAAARAGHISYWSYVRPLLGTLLGYRHPEMRLEVDDEVIEPGPGLLLAGNLPRYALGLRILAGAEPDDGLLDLCYFRCRSWFSLFGHALNVLLGRHLRSRHVIYRQARELRVQADSAVPVQVDGDAAGVLPLVLRVTEKRARFLVPQEGWR